MLNVYGVEVGIVYSPVRISRCRFTAKDLKTAEQTIRRIYAETFQSARRENLKSVAVGVVNCLGISFPAIGVAKILSQEILKVLREPSGIKKITVVVPDKTRLNLFQKQVYGYIDHVLNDLGKGPYVTVDAIIELKGGIVLIERSNPPLGWALPGGFVDYGETLEGSVVREVKEETNLKFVNIRQLHTYSDPKRDPRFQTIATVFVGKGVGVPKSGDDAKGLKIVPYKDLLKIDCAFDHKKILKDYLKMRDLDV